MRTALNPSRIRGATIIEFALVGFLFFFVMWAIFEFSRAFYVANTIQHLTRCMVREAVVRVPSDYNGAKQACLMGTAHTWPFFDLSAADLTSSFHLSYHFTYWNGGAQTATQDLDEGNVGTAYDHQDVACYGGIPNNCITQVTASFDAKNHKIVALGLFAGWIGSPSKYSAFSAETTMPAENMGCYPDRTGPCAPTTP